MIPQLKIPVISGNVSVLMHGIEMEKLIVLSVYKTEE